MKALEILTAKISRKAALLVTGMVLIHMANDQETKLMIGVLAVTGTFLQFIVDAHKFWKKG
jgi:hypothetical protein